MDSRPLPNYKDSPNGEDTFAIGSIYEDHVRWLAENLGFRFRPMTTYAGQIYTGDFIDQKGRGWEVKFDGTSEKTKRLSIEIAEKTCRDGVKFPSGIFSSSNAVFYVQGHLTSTWVFYRAELIDYFNTTKPEVFSFNETVWKFYLPIQQADLLAKAKLR